MIKVIAAGDTNVLKYAVLSETVFAVTIYCILEAMKTADCSKVLLVTQLSFTLVVLQRKTGL